MYDTGAVLPVGEPMLTPGGDAEACEVFWSGDRGCPMSDNVLEIDIRVFFCD